jgi:hypothetical protein
MKRHAGDSTANAFGALSLLIDMPADGSQPPDAWLIDNKALSTLSPELWRCGAPVGEESKPAYIMAGDFSFNANDSLTFWDLPYGPAW